jgi:hydrogenase maturation protease
VQRFALPARRHVEPLTGPDGQRAGELVREQSALTGELEVSARPVGDLFRVTVRVRNLTPLEGAAGDREAALRHTFVSTHTILHVQGGAFVSLLDPPAACQDHAAACRNVGTFPVLVGEPGQTDTLLSSPIILYDYPRVAPESPGDLFDATEIDEILTLRILTLTDEEKREMCAADKRARALLERTEALAREQLLGLHGAVRSLRPLPRRDADEQ